MNPFKTLLARLFRCAPQRPYEAPGPDSVGISAVSPSTKLVVDGEFDPDRASLSELKFTSISSEMPPPLITFNAVNRPILTIKPDGKIILHDDADPTEAAKQCLDAMQHLLHGMLQKQEDETRAALVAEIVAWLWKEAPAALHDPRMVGDEIKAKWGKQ